MTLPAGPSTDKAEASALEDKGGKGKAGSTNVVHASADEVVAAGTSSRDAGKETKAPVAGKKRSAQDLSSSSSEASDGPKTDQPSEPDDATNTSPSPAKKARKAGRKMPPPRPDNFMTRKLRSSLPKPEPCAAAPKQGAKAKASSQLPGKASKGKASASEPQPKAVDKSVGKSGKAAGTSNGKAAASSKGAKAAKAASNSGSDDDSSSSSSSDSSSEGESDNDSSSSSGSESSEEGEDEQAVKQEDGVKQEEEGDSDGDGEKAGPEGGADSADTSDEETDSGSDYSYDSEASSDEDAGADARGEGGEAGPLLLVREVSPAEASKQAEEVQTMWEFAAVTDFLFVFGPAAGITATWAPDTLASALVTATGAAGDLLQELHTQLLMGITRSPKLGPSCWQHFLSHWLIHEHLQSDKHWRAKELCSRARLLTKAKRDENGRLRSRKARRIASELGSDASEDARAMPFTPPSKQEAQAYAALSTKRRLYALNALCELRLEREDLRAAIDDALAPDKLAAAAGGASGKDGAAAAAGGKGAAAVAAAAGASSRLALPPARLTRKAMEQTEVKINRIVRGGGLPPSGEVWELPAVELRKSVFGQDSWGNRYWLVGHVPEPSARIYKEQPPKFIRPKVAAPPPSTPPPPPPIKSSKHGKHKHGKDKDGDKEQEKDKGKDKDEDKGKNKDSSKDKMVKGQDDGKDSSKDFRKGKGKDKDKDAGKDKGKGKQKDKDSKGKGKAGKEKGKDKSSKEHVPRKEPFVLMPDAKQGRWESLGSTVDELRAWGEGLRARSKKKADQELAAQVVDGVVESMAEAAAARERQAALEARVRAALGDAFYDSLGRSKRQRKEIDYSTDKYDKAMNKAIHAAKSGKEPSPEPPPAPAPPPPERKPRAPIGQAPIDYLAPPPNGTAAGRSARYAARLGADPSEIDRQQQQAGGAADGAAASQQLAEGSCQQPVSSPPLEVVQLQQVALEGDEGEEEEAGYGNEASNTAAASYGRANGGGRKGRGQQAAPPGLPAHRRMPAGPRQLQPHMPQQQPAPAGMGVVNGGGMYSGMMQQQQQQQQQPHLPTSMGMAGMPPGSMPANTNMMFAQHMQLQQMLANQQMLSQQQQQQQQQMAAAGFFNSMGGYAAGMHPSAPDMPAGLQQFPFPGPAGMPGGMMMEGMPPGFPFPPSGPAGLPGFTPYQRWE